MVDIVEHIGEYSTNQLAAYLTAGATVRFPNGCFISFVVVDGLCCGDSPYGAGRLFSMDDEYMDRLLHYIIKWLAYWDEPRTEVGNLLTGIMDYPTFCNVYRLFLFDRQTPIEHESYMLRMLESK